MSKDRKQNNTVLIRKQARGFRVDEVLFLYNCRDVYHGILSGPFWIREIKHMTDTTVTFIVWPAVGRGFGGAWKAGVRSYALEFLRDQPLHRISGPIVSTIIEEQL